jgi:hypothetical protein
MRAYVKSSLGVDTPVTPEAPVNEPASARTPPFTQQTLSLMGVAALPWLPVAAGAWIGDKYDSKGWGALVGATFSFLVIRTTLKQLAGNIT